MITPTPRDLSLARDHFRDLLDRPTTEPEWQRFFTQCPYVLSRSLPFRLEQGDIVPLGRVGRSEPDFIFYPREPRPVPFYGVIELKPHDSPIVSRARSNLVIMSRDAETAVQQAELYATPPCSFLPKELNESPLILGNHAYLFVIMGMSTEITEKLGNALHRDFLERRLPKNLQLLPYDTVLRQFEAGLQPRVYVLKASSPDAELKPDKPKEWPYYVRLPSDECVYDENGNCINDNQKHWGANE